MKKSMFYCLLAGAALSACQQHSAPPYADSPTTAPAATTPVPSSPSSHTEETAAGEMTVFRPVGGLRDIMAYEVDPSADALWGSVSIVTDKHGIKDNHPTTEAQWNELRGRAVILIEAANLLIIDGRRVVREGDQRLDDQGTPGNYSAEQAQQAIAANRGVFVSYSKSLGLVGEQLLKAIDEKNPQNLLDAGAALDEVCEGCHLKFWYPGQSIPRFPDHAPHKGV